MKYVVDYKNTSDSCRYDRRSEQRSSWRRVKSADHRATITFIINVLLPNY